MRKMIVVAMREYLAAVKTKAFIIGLVAMPAFYIAMFAVQYFLKDKVDTTDRRVAVMDHSGFAYNAISTAAEQYNTVEVFRGEGPDRRQVKPRFLFEEVEPTPDESPEQFALRLSNRVREKDLFAFVVVEPNVLDADAGGAVRYHSNAPTFSDLPEWIASVLNRHVRELRFRQAQLDLEAITRASRPVPMANLGLVSVDPTGRIKEAEPTNRIANMLVPLAAMLLMFIVVMVGASPLMQSVLEEKMQRIAEVLLGSVRPFELMMGKLLGMVGVSLTMATVYIVGAYLAMQKAGYVQFFPAQIVWWFVAYLAMAVLMYGAVFIAVGAAVTDLKESQALVTPVMLIVISPMVIWVNVLKEPQAAYSVVASLFPPATPMLMLLRQTVPPGVPQWQPLLGMALMLLTTVLLVFAAGRIFRVGILMQGRGAKFRELCRWVFTG
jgi:ABC-2 type transport system permease protein